jgi:hypothetical protein
MARTTAHAASIGSADRTTGQSSRLLESEVGPEGRKRTKARDDEEKAPYGRTWIAFLALLLLIAVITVQLIGLAAAVRSRRVPDLLANWCSPMFTPFVVAILNGDCQLHDVTGREHWGNGCISLPAQEQSDWLIGTIVLLSLAFAFQFFDFCVLALVNDKERWQQVKMKRP